ncbi:hypothetical protein EOD39_2030 [Acipenser ruthenus]|uniref:EF-hand domain-containing protein n=1 Tax=Acipenser ruthenus TaxID=7906 RepID=A0A444U4V3_ACIRT|nr:hypothetical protein EOD39_2030 [Acipenser ruthenus]
MELLNRSPMNKSQPEDGQFFKPLSFKCRSVPQTHRLTPPSHGPSLPCPRFAAHMKSSPGSLGPPGAHRSKPQSHPCDSLDAQRNQARTARSSNWSCAVFNPKKSAGHVQHLIVFDRASYKKPSSPAPSTASHAEDNVDTQNCTQPVTQPIRDYREEEEHGELEVPWADTCLQEDDAELDKLEQLRESITPALSSNEESLSDFSRPPSSAFSRSTSLHSGRTSQKSDPSELSSKSFELSNVQSDVSDELEGIVPRTGSSLSQPCLDSRNDQYSSPGSALLKGTSSQDLVGGDEPGPLSDIRLLLLDHQSWGGEPLGGINGSEADTIAGDHMGTTANFESDILGGYNEIHSNGKQHRKLEIITHRVQASPLLGCVLFITHRVPASPLLGCVLFITHRVPASPLLGCVLFITHRVLASPLLGCVLFITHRVQASPLLGCVLFITHRVQASPLLGCVLFPGNLLLLASGPHGTPSKTGCRSPSPSSPARGPSSSNLSTSNSFSSEERDSQLQSTGWLSDSSAPRKEDPRSVLSCPVKGEKSGEAVRRGQGHKKKPLKLDCTWREEREKERLAEERQAKIFQIYTKLRENKTSRAQSAEAVSISKFEDFDFLAKYCIFSQEKLAKYKRAFEAADSDGDGYLTCFQVLVALKEIVPPSALTDAEEIYVYRQLFLCNIDSQSNSISVDQLVLELKAGGISEEHEEAVCRELKHIQSLDLLDFLTYLPLFVLIHNSVISNPLDDSRTL